MSSNHHVKRKFFAKKTYIVPLVSLFTMHYTRLRCIVFIKGKAHIFQEYEEHGTPTRYKEAVHYSMALMSRCTVVLSLCVSFLIMPPYKSLKITMSITIFTQNT